MPPTDISDHLSSYSLNYNQQVNKDYNDTHAPLNLQLQRQDLQQFQTTVLL